MTRDEPQPGTWEHTVGVIRAMPIEEFRAEIQKRRDVMPRSEFVARAHRLPTADERERVRRALVVNDD